MKIQKTIPKYTIPKKYFDLKKQQELLKEEKAKQAQKLFEAGVERLEKFIEAQNDPQHLINILV